MFGLIAVFLLGILFSGVTHHQHFLIQTDEKAHTEGRMALYRKKFCGEFCLLTSKIRCVPVAGMDQTRSRTLKYLLNSEANTQLIITMFLCFFLEVGTLIKS